MAEPLLDVQNLTIAFPSDRGPIDVVKSISFGVGREIVAVVGESGSGKSMTGRAIMGLLPPQAKVRAEAMRFDGVDLQTMRPSQWNGLRGDGIGLILQNPKFSLNPAHRIGRQIEETLLLHTKLSAGERRDRALEMMDKVGLADPKRVYDSYPAALSGGMGQRVMIAAMLINRPKLIIADEPTSALDHDLQEQILLLLRSLVEEFGMAMMLISHDLQQVARYADRVIVLRQGEIVDRLPAASLAEAKSPYTRGLWAARPSVTTYGTRLPVIDDEDAT
ncbi:ATP-binding cassette domain-containing protein [Rhizobium tumorigenes]|uniref:ABC transporter ATP-binding protein n=1 Tax=Rhizobium tumorigenes TaxID=2041385 RepID=A0AAF1K953_9HYPH|nr:ABC transporter ATP-binding protein [Rhizobium tumorigenes]WFR98075.1 ABC transporter ATP-binding protein [Rhizobium tumorigenes]